MRVNRGLLGWGVFFLALGSVPLAVQGGVVDASLARRAWELWPLLLIGVGLGLALRNTPLDPLGGVVAAATFGLMAGGLVAGGIGGAPFALCGSGDGAQPTGQPITGGLAGSASIDVSLNCGSLEVSAQTGGQWSIAWPLSSTLKPDVVEASSSRLQVELGNRHGFGGGAGAAFWDVRLPADPTTAVSVSVNAGSAHVALEGAHVSALSASVNGGEGRINLSGAIGTTSIDGSVNAGSLTIALPSPAATLQGSLSANAGSLRVCAPPSVPLRIRVANQSLGSTNLAQRGLAQNGDTWTRGAWDTATARIDLTVSANLGSVTLDPEDGCG